MLSPQSALARLAPCIGTYPVLRNADFAYLAVPASGGFRWQARPVSGVRNQDSGAGVAGLGRAVESCLQHYFLRNSFFPRFNNTE